MYYTQNSGEPRAFITKSKQRLKQFGQNVYLSNGSEFELELYNPTSKTVLAKIKFNGLYIKGGGIIVKPGQRIFLERYLDDAKKFKFETYEVEANSDEVKKAISDNGDVTVEFYNEQDPILDNYYWNNTYNYYPKYNLTNLPTYDSFTSNCFYSSSISTNSFGSQNSLPKLKTLRSISKSTLETGTVEKGSNSNQSFTYVNKEFNSYTTATSYWKILPESQKPYEKQDIKVFCTNCGTKRKKDSHKFCPNCGKMYQ
jgi:hypothetical protein